jgi:hypothetical protein
MGISFASGAADPELQALARRAQSGDKQAQLELGIRYEEGRGLPVDLERAERLYRTAGADSGGTTYVYSPPVGQRGRGEVAELLREPRAPGLSEAEQRLARLSARRGRGPALQPALTHQNASNEVAERNAAVLDLWHSIVSLLEPTSSSHDDLRAILARTVTALPASNWRFNVRDIVCSNSPSAADFPMVAAACETGRSRFQVNHFWDEELSPGGTTHLASVRSGCLSAGEALAMLRGWRPRVYFPSPPIVPVRDSPGTFVESTVEPKTVFTSAGGHIVYVDDYAQGSCLSNFYVVVPLD